MLALGCNVFNMGFFSCFVAYPLVYLPIAGARRTRGRVMAGAIAASVVALALGALGVVLETTLSRISSLPFRPLVLLMIPIHVAIGLVEGAVTASVVALVQRGRPELVGGGEVRPRRLRPVLLAVAAAAAMTGGVLSWFASTHPDGLEWAVARTAGDSPAAATPNGALALLGRIQGKTAILPDYDFAGVDPARAASARSPVKGGRSLAGVLGAGLTFGVAILIGASIRRLRRR